MTDAERKILYALAGMIEQYLDEKDGEIDNLSMSAGETAIDTLAKFGLVEKRNERISVWTKAGLDLLDEDDAYLPWR